MNTRNRALLLCGLLALQGCAGETTNAQQARAPSAARPAAPPAGELTPQNEAALYLNVIEGLERQQRHGAALAFLDDFARQRPALPPRYWLLRGDALLGLGRQDEASLAYGRLDDTGLAAQGWNGQGRAAASQRDWTLAAERFRKAVAGDPSNADFLNNLAFASLHLGASAQSAAYLRQAHELAPDSDLIRNNLIIALTLKGDQPGADAILKAIPDSARREQAKAVVRAVIQKGGLDQEGKS